MKRVYWADISELTKSQLLVAQGFRSELSCQPWTYFQDWEKRFLNEAMWNYSGHTQYFTEPI